MLELCGLLCSFFIPNFITLFFYILFTLIFFDYYWSALFNKANTIINTISFTHVQKNFSQDSTCRIQTSPSQKEELYYQLSYILFRQFISSNFLDV